MLCACEMDLLWSAVVEHYIVASVVSLSVLLWLYSYFSCGVCKSKARMDGKTVIITGANTGIGKETALDLARRGARVILACRNLDKAHAARDDIIKKTENQNVIVKQVDMSLMSSVRRFAEDINKSERRLDVLIHNAGISHPLFGQNVTPEGLQTVWATNHFGPFLLTHLLIDLMKKTGKSRIIIVSSILHMVGSVSLTNPNPVDEKSTYKLYTGSKFANVLFANELARRLKGTGVTSNSLHPGVIHTSIWAQNPWYILLFVKILSIYFKSEEQGAQTTMHLAVSDEVEEVTGKFFCDCKPFPSSRRTRDVQFAIKYWELCEEVVKLRPTDPRIHLTETKKTN